MDKQLHPTCINIRNHLSMPNSQSNHVSESSTWTTSQHISVAFQGISLLVNCTLHCQFLFFCWQFYWQKEKYKVRNFILPMTALQPIYKMKYWPEYPINFDKAYNTQSATKEYMGSQEFLFTQISGHIPVKILKVLNISKLHENFSIYSGDPL